MGGESSKSDGGDGRAGRQKSADTINAVFVANVCNFTCATNVFNLVSCSYL